MLKLKKDATKATANSESATTTNTIIYTRLI